MPDLKALERVIAAISEAREGGHELDVRISVALGELRSGSAKLLKLFVDEGYDWNVVSALLDEQVPPYSTSLDAAVPGEHVVGVLYSQRRGRWAAIHRGPDGGEEGPIWAATEALARRAAGLTGLAGAAGGEARRPLETLLPGEEPADRSGETVTGERAAENTTEDEEELPDWKILF